MASAHPKKRRRSAAGPSSAPTPPVLAKAASTGDMEMDKTLLETQVAALMQGLGPAVNASAVASMVAAAEASLAADGNDVPGDRADGSPTSQLLAAVLGKTQSNSLSDVARQRARTVAQALAALATALTASQPAGALKPFAAAAAPAAAAASLQVQVETLKSDVASLRERLGSAEEEARVASRTLTRARLDYPHVAFADGPMPLAEEAKAKAAAAAQSAAAAAAAASAAGSAGTTVGTAVLSSNGGNTGGGVSNGTLAELQEALEEATAEAETYKSIMQKQKETLSKLNATVKSLSDNMAAVTAQPVKESDVKAHPAHVDALKQLAIVVRQRDLLKADLEQCTTDLKTVRSQVETALKQNTPGHSAAEEAFAAEISKLSGELSAAKAQASMAAQREAVAQVRAQRVTELESTVTEQNRALDQLQADATRWRSDWKARAGTENTKVKEFVDVLAAKVEKLSRLVGERDSAIDAMKAAERSVARDEHIQAALKAASEGADAAAAANAAALTRLRGECAELQEKLSAARAEAVQHRSEREKVAVQYTALQAQLLSAVAEREATEEAVDEVSEAYEQTQVAAADALGKLASKDRVLGNMASSLSESKSQLVQLTAQVAQLQEQHTAHVQAAQDHETLQSALEQELRQTKEALTDSVAQYQALRASKVLEWATLPHSGEGGAAERLLQATSNAQRDALQVRVDDLLKQVASSSSRERDALDASEELRLELEQTRSRLAAALKRGGGGAEAAAGAGPAVDKDTRRELRDLREMVFCPVDNTKLKSAVLRQCGHGMSKEALEQRLKDRLRRCPVCNKGFAADDVVDLHLGSM